MSPTEPRTRNTIILRHLYLYYQLACYFISFILFFLLSCNIALDFSKTVVFLLINYIFTDK
jgi:hypothetical protein